MIQSIVWRQVGDQHKSGYRVRRSFTKWLTSFVWQLRLNQAIKLQEMRGQPRIIKALHAALREKEPMYLDDWQKTNIEVGNAVEDLHDLTEWLREEKDYAKADRLRTIMGRLARSVPQDLREDNSPIRNRARSYK